MKEPLSPPEAKRLIREILAGGEEEIRQESNKNIYSALILAFTANNVPYSALTGVLSTDPRERTSISSFRFFFAPVVTGFTA